MSLEIAVSQRLGQKRIVTLQTHCSLGSGLGGLFEPKAPFGLSPGLSSLGERKRDLGETKPTIVRHLQ